MRKPADERALRRARLSTGGSQLLGALERTTGITPSGALVVGLILSGFVAGRALRSRPVLVMVYGLLAFVVISWMLGRRKLAVDARRSDLPSRAREGQVIAVELGLIARRRLSTVVLEEELHHELGTSVRIPVPLLPSGEEVSHPYTFSPSRRGVYDVGPLVAEWTDPFGLTRRRMTIAEPARIIVHPATQPIHDRISQREWEDPPIRPPISKPWPNGFEFYGMRDYVSGDDPRRIVWRAVARTGDDPGTMRYMVRESEQGITDQVNLFLDSDMEHHSPGKERSETFETAVQTVASLGIKHLADGFSVNLDLNGGRVARNLRGKLHEIRLLDELAVVEREKVPLVRALERLLVDPRRTSHNVIVTTHLEVDTAARLRLMRQRGTSMLVVLVLWEGTHPGTIHRAGSVGVNVVELTPGMPLDRQFAKVVGAGRR